jgi:hypothetical protein
MLDMADREEVRKQMPTVGTFITTHAESFPINPVF